MNPYHHALSSAKKHGGEPEDYLALHQWFDESKAYFPDFRHRALRHHAEGIFLAERIFGPVVKNADGKLVFTRVLGEQHVREDLGRIPTAQDWLACLKPESWMMRPGKLLHVEAPEPDSPDGERSGNGKGDGGEESDGEYQNEKCECERPGYFCSGVPGIIARVENGRLPAGAKVERCDLCKRYSSDEAALQRLCELGIA